MTIFETCAVAFVLLYLANTARAFWLDRAAKEWRVKSFDMERRNFEMRLAEHQDRLETSAVFKGGTRNWADVGKVADAMLEKKEPKP